LARELGPQGADYINKRLLGSLFCSLATTSLCPVTELFTILKSLFPPPSTTTSTPTTRPFGNLPPSYTTKSGTSPANTSPCGVALHKLGPRPMERKSLPPPTPVSPSRDGGSRLGSSHRRRLAQQVASLLRHRRLRHRLPRPLHPLGSSPSGSCTGSGAWRSTTSSPPSRWPTSTAGKPSNTTEDDVAADDDDDDMIGAVWPPGWAFGLGLGSLCWGCGLLGVFSACSGRVYS